MDKSNSAKNKKKVEEKSLFWNNSVTTWLFFSLIIVCFSTVFFYVFDEKLNLGGDNAAYFILGKALSEGLGYSNIQLPIPTPHTHFPPGYPALLSVFMFFGIQSIVGLKVVTGLFFLGSLLLLYRILKKLGANAGMAFTVVILVLFNFHMLYYSTIMMSEIPFLFFTLWSLWLLLKIEARNDWFRDQQFYLWILVITFAFHIRTMGIALIFAYAIYLILSKKAIQAGALIGGFIALSLPWQLRNIKLGGSQYLNQLIMKNPYRPEEGTMSAMDWLERLFNNGYRYVASEIPSTFYPVLQIEYYEAPVAMHLFLGIPILILGIIGLRSQKKFNRLLLIYLGASFGILLVWPDIWFGPRFMLPLLPFLIFLVVKGLEQLIIQYTPIKTISPYWFLLFLVIYIKPVKGLRQFAESPYLPEYERYFEAAKWMERNSPMDAIVSTRKPNLFYLFANRPSINYPYDTNYTSFLDTLDAKGVTHVVMEQLGYSSGVRYLYPAVVANQEKFRTLFQTRDPQAYVFAFNNTFGYRGEWKVDGDVNASKEPIIGIKEGFGSYVFTNGGRYEGNWKNDMQNGFGILYYPNGSRFEGEWKNNQRQGPGKLIGADGSILQEGHWENDEFTQ